MFGAGVPNLNDFSRRLPDNCKYKKFSSHDDVANHVLSVILDVAQVIDLESKVANAVKAASFQCPRKEDRLIDTVCHWYTPCVGFSHINPDIVWTTCGSNRVIKKACSVFSSLFDK
jgi:hypothetical protein